MFNGLLRDIEALRRSDERYAVRGQLDSAGACEIRLLKDRFWIQNVVGHIAELKLRCQRSFVFYEFEPGASYDVTDEVGRCGLQVIGDPDTEFRLMQE
jgi:hypothetical protein